MGDEKKDKLDGSLSPFAILRKLDEVMFEVRAIKASLEDQKKLNDDIIEIRHNFKVMKNVLTWVMTPAMAIVVAVVMAKFGLFSKPAPAVAPPSQERMGSDFVPKPSTP
jgi:hypothetical protein